ncbi:MAG: glycosyltransferase [Desulfocapsa sp.]|nr:glycosyltransferase [Desulfocapsa sp.]
MSIDTNRELSASIVITTYNEVETIEACIDSVLRQTCTDFELLVIDDGSSDGTPELLQKYDDPRISVHAFKENCGVSCARNKGINEGCGKVVVFIDADAVALEDWLKHLLEPFAEAEVACVGGPDVAPADDGVFALSLDYTLRSLIATGNVRQQTALARYSPAACNLAIRRSVLEEVGLFDKRLNCRGEEKELEQRIRRHGYRIHYAPKAIVWHHRRGTLRSFWYQTFLSGRARIDILRLAPDAIEPAHLFPALLTLVLLTALLAFPWWPGTPILAFPVIIYVVALLFNGLLGVVSVRRLGALGIVPVTTAVVHLGYGSGFLVRLLEISFRRIFNNSYSFPWR